MPEMILELFGAVPPWFLLLLIPLYFWGNLIRASLQSKDTHPESFERTVGWLRENSFERLYLDLISKVLKQVSGLIQDDNGLSSNGFTFFNAVSYGFCLKIALIYPMILFYVSAFFGSEDLIVNYLPIDNNGMESLIILVGLASLILFSCLALAKEVYKNREIGLLQALKNELSFIFGYSNHTFFLTIYMFIGTGLAFLSNISFIDFFLFLAVLIPALTLASGSQSFSSLDYEILKSAVFPFAFLFSIFILIFMLTGKVLQGATILLFLWTGIVLIINHVKEPVYYWLGVNIFLIALSYACLLSIQTPSSLVFIQLLILFPLGNAFFDWLSLGVTRVFLQRVVSENHRVLGVFGLVIVDLVMALLFLFVVTGLLVLIVSVGNLITGMLLIDIRELLLNIQRDPGNISHWWIYSMLLTTLVPTLLHFALAGGAATLWLPRRWRLTVANGLEQDVYKTFAAWGYLTLTPVVGFIIAPGVLLYFLYLLITTHDAWLGIHLISWANMLLDLINPSA